MARQAIVAQRLLGEDVERRAGEAPGLEGLVERLLVDHAAAGAVDQHGPGLHRGDARGVEKVLGLVGERHVERHHVGAPEELLEGEGLHVEPAHEARIEHRIVGHHLHVEGLSAPGHLLADTAEPDDPEGLALELGAHESLAVPFLGLERAVGRRDVARQRQEQGEGVLGGREQVGRRRVDHQDAELGRRVDVDVVDADAGAADDPEPRMTGGEHVGSHLGAASHHQGVVAADDLRQAGALFARQLEDLVTRVAEHLEPGRFEGIGDQDLVRHFRFSLRRGRDRPHGWGRRSAASN